VKEKVMAAAQDTRRKPDEGIWETIKVILQALLIAFFVKTFLYQPFNIPSASMYPTLMKGDYLFVSKLSYGYSKFSFNFTFGLLGHTVLKCCSLDFPGRVVLADTPKRGDVAVFKLPSDTEIDYIKRVIGLPGDHVQMKDGVLYINGAAVPKKPIEPYYDSEPNGEGNGRPIPQFVETLPNGISYRVLDSNPNGSLDNTQEFVVPEGHYFMMGDNRDNSSDSRYRDINGNYPVGYVPIENFVGRADVLFFSISDEAQWWQVWRWPLAIRWSRFFTLL
jgi:signal peptidase I